MRMKRSLASGEYSVSTWLRRASSAPRLACATSVSAICRARRPWASSTFASSEWRRKNTVSAPSSTNATVRTPAYQATRRKLSERVFMPALVLGEAVTDAAHGADELHRERIIHLAAQMAYVHVHDVRQALEALVPDVLDDHGAREHPPGVGGEVLKQCVFLGRELDLAPAAAHLLREAIHLQIRNPQHARAADRPAPQQRLDAHDEL